MLLMLLLAKNKLRVFLSRLLKIKVLMSLLPIDQHIAAALKANTFAILLNSRLLLHNYLLLSPNFRLIRAKLLANVVVLLIVHFNLFLIILH